MPAAPAAAAPISSFDPGRGKIGLHRYNIIVEPPVCFSITNSALSRHCRRYYIILRSGPATPINIGGPWVISALSALSRISAPSPRCPTGRRRHAARRDNRFLPQYPDVSPHRPTVPPTRPLGLPPTSVSSAPRISDGNKATQIFVAGGGDAVMPAAVG